MILVATCGVPALGQPLELDDVEIAARADRHRLSPELADLTRQQLRGMRGMFQPLHPIESVTFRSVDIQGANVFDVTLANGSVAYPVLALICARRCARRSAAAG